MNSMGGVERCERLNNAADFLKGHPNATCEAFGDDAQQRIDRENYIYDPEMTGIGGAYKSNGEYTGVIGITDEGFNYSVPSALIQIVAHEEAHLRM